MRLKGIVLDLRTSSTNQRRIGDSGGPYWLRRGADGRIVVSPESTRITLGGPNLVILYVVRTKLTNRLMAYKDLDAEFLNLPVF